MVGQTFPAARVTYYEQPRELPELTQKKLAQARVIVLLLIGDCN